MGAWIIVGLLAAGGILFQENQTAAMKFVGRYLPAEKSEKHEARKTLPEPRHKVTAQRTAERAVERKATLVSLPKPVQRPAGELTAAEPAFAGTWYLCASRTDNCVSDSSTIVHNGKKIHIADIATPETRQAKCENERRRGMETMMRLKDLLNAGPFTEIEATGRQDGGTGQTLRVLIRHGESVGGQLVKEGLARKWTGKKQTWCGGKV
ncbi:hypothetical protein [Pararhizobium sp.]|uniref:hypothetical protein n=1 Tax=Pararhizobium sp. TaxID=1977563 RepID=UPI002721F528|nr:hypothetical protein [Pararhizobium sp.]MDO9417924.1 hypothetical protein [Pararhizobium sp.]